MFHSPFGRAGPRGFSPATAARHLQFRIPAGGFPHSMGNIGFYWVFLPPCPGPRIVLDPAPPPSSENFRMATSPKSAFGVFCMVSGAGKRREEAAKTTFPGKKRVKIGGKTLKKSKSQKSDLNCQRSANFGNNNPYGV